jgi:predicted nuclease of predicted toxin-antitoxin system
MKFLIDANLSPRVARRLSATTHEAVHVNDAGLGTAADDVILQRAADAGEVIISADADFGALLALRRQASPSVVLLRSSDHLTPDEQSDLIIRALDTVAEDLVAGAIASVTPSRIRIRTLPVHDE